MVRITNNSLLIEFPLHSNESAFEKLSSLQTGLLGLLSVIDHKEGAETLVSEGIAQLRHVLQGLMFTPGQMMVIEDAVTGTPSLLNKLNER